MSESPTDQGQEIGRRLAQARQELGLSQGEFADKLGCSKRGLQDNEGGYSLPNSKLLIGVAELGINVNWLLTGGGDKTNQPDEECVTPPSLEELLTKALAAIEGCFKEELVKLPVDLRSSLLALTVEAVRGGKDSFDLQAFVGNLKKILFSNLSSDEIALLAIYREATPGRKRLMLIPQSNKSGEKLASA